MIKLKQVLLIVIKLIKRTFTATFKDSKNMFFLLLFIFLFLIFLLREVITATWLSKVAFPLLGEISCSGFNDMLVLGTTLLCVVLIVWYAKRNRRLTKKIDRKRMFYLWFAVVFYLWARSTYSNCFVATLCYKYLFYADFAILVFALSLALLTCSVKRSSIIDKSKIKDKLMIPYLRLDKVDYAIMINGDWGEGKTYYWNNVLAKQLRDAGFRTVYISLFGIADVDGLKDAIKDGLHPYRKHPLTRVMSDLGKNILSFLGIEWTREDTDMLITSTGNLDWARIVFCFDDVERASGDLQELLGYINDIVEHHSSHVFLIAAENKIESSSYYKCKEKLVRFTWRYDGNFDIAFQDIVKIYSKANPENRLLSSFYVDYVKSIYNALGVRNLRTLSLNLGALDRCWDILANYKNDNCSAHIFKHFIFVCTIYSIVIQEKGKDALEKILDITDEHGFQIDDSMFGLHERKENINEEESELEKYRADISKKLIPCMPSGKYGCSNAIYGYLLTGLLDETKFKEEVNNALTIIKKYFETSTEHYLLGILGNCWNQGDEYLQNTVDKIIELCGSGKIELAYYPDFYQNIISLREYLFVDFPQTNEELKEVFHDGMRNAPHKVQEDIKGRYIRIVHKSKECKELIDEVTRLHNLKKNETEIKDFIEILNNNKNWDMLDGWEDSEYPLFNQLDPVKFLEAYVNSDNNGKHNVAALLDRRLSIQTFLSEEKEFFIGLVVCCDDWMAKNKNSVTKAYVRTLKHRSEKVTKFLDE